jgi:hypothetical protein
MRRGGRQNEERKQEDDNWAGSREGVIASNEDRESVKRRERVSGVKCTK